jgi:hypothetical protein
MGILTRSPAIDSGFAGQVWHRNTLIKTQSLLPSNTNIILSENI